MNLRNLAFAGLSAMAIQAGCNNTPETTETTSVQAAIDSIRDSKQTCIEQYRTLEGLKAITDLRNQTELSDAMAQDLASSDASSRSNVSRIEIQNYLESSAITLALAETASSPECEEQLRAEIAERVERCAIPRAESIEQFMEYSELQPNLDFARNVLDSEESFCELDPREKQIVINTLREQRADFNETQLSNARALFFIGY